VGILNWLFQRRSATPRDYGIFISYSRQDGKLVMPLVEMLRLGGNGVFRDIDHIRPGTKWRAVLIEAVNSCELLVLFWCHHSARSSEVQKEYTQALQRGKLLIPVLLDNTPLSGALSDYQAIDMRGLFLHEDIEPLGRQIAFSIAPPTPWQERRARAEAARRLDEALSRLINGLGTQFAVLESRRHAEPDATTDGGGI
jgi:hypothetical protein